MNTLNQLELIILYTTIQRRLKEIIKEAQQKIKVISKALITVLIYDNFKFTVDHRGERINDSQNFYSIIITLLFKSHNYRAAPLWQSMW